MCMLPILRTRLASCGRFESRGRHVMNEPDVIVGIGGAAGDGVASAGNTLALSVARQGQAVYAYNSYQSVIRGGHSWLRLRISARSRSTTAIRSTRSSPSTRTPWTATCRSSLPAALALYNSAKLRPSYEPPPGRAALPPARPRADPRLQGSAGHAEHGGRRGRHSSHGAGFHRAGVGARVDVHEEAARRHSERRGGKGRLRPRRRPLQAAGHAAQARPTKSGPWSPATS